MTPRTRALVLGGALALASLIALLVWGNSSPVGSAPDDDFHMTSIYCPPPLATSGCQTYYDTEDEMLGVYAPELVADPNCYAFHPRVTGACQERLSSTELVRTTRVDQGNYPGPYYRFAHLFVTDNVASWVLALRDFNAALAVVLIGAAVLLTAPLLRPGLAWALACSVVPMGMSIIPSINPSSWAFSGLTAFWISTFAMARARTVRHRLLAGGVAMAGATVALVARNDSALYVVLGLAATAVLYVPLPKRRAASDGGQDAPTADDKASGRRELLWTIVPWAVVVVFSLALSVWSFTSATSSGGIQASASRLRRDPVGLLLYNIMESLQVPGGLLGMAALGWNDVRPPALVYMTAIGIAAFVLLSGLRSLSWRKALALAGISGTLLILPLVMLQRAMAYVGDQVQPRYFLAILPLLAGVALLGRDGRRVLGFGRWQAVAAWGGLTMANSLTLWLYLHRYTLGVYAPFTLDEPVDWWWNVGPSPMAMWVIGSVAFAAATFVLVAVSFPRPRWRLRRTTSSGPSAVQGAPATAPNDTSRTAPQDPKVAAPTEITAG